MTLRAWMRCLAAMALAGMLASGAAEAAKAPFDLAGPTLKVTITRGAKTLPVAQAPDLAAGDVIVLRPAFPPGQAAQYLLVAAFLRGATNPPPKSWFFGLKTWERGGHGELKVKVPEGAEQALIFLAPHTVGDFDTLRDAVRGRPGAFVRASQDLNQLGLDRERLNVFLSAVRATERSDPSRLQSVTTDLARTLGIKLDTHCFEKSPDLQAPCLMQDQDSLVLENGQNSSVVKSLSSGAPADLMTQLGYAPQMGAGAYSPYVGAVLDIARLLDSLGEARFQYVPALAALEDDSFQLRLNTAPSFGGVKSVLVASLPPVEPVQPPVLNVSDPKATYCLQASDTTLKVDGAPLVFSTSFAQNMRLRVRGKSGETFDTPVTADPEKGGYVADTSGLDPKDFPAELVGVLHGAWGFSEFEGPQFQFQTAQLGLWRLNEADQAALVVGRDDPVRLTGGPSACVRAVTLRQAGAASQPAPFKVKGPQILEVVVPLAQATPGPLTLDVQAYGSAAPDPVTAEAFVPASRVDQFAFHAGDNTGELRGAGLSAVARLTLGGARFTPASGEPNTPDDPLTLASSDDHALEALAPGRKLAAKVALKDGRTLTLPVVVLAPRPQISLLAQSLRLPPGESETLPIHLTTPDRFPRGAVVTFSIQAHGLAAIAPSDRLEVATADGAFSTTLSPGAGLTREDAHLAVAALDTASAFGSSAFGPLRFRLLDPVGDSDWQNLGVLVRLPVLTRLTCSDGSAGPCVLKGDGLFLIEAVARNASFDGAATLPEGFPGDHLDVPHPRQGRLYLKLHDDPSAAAILTLSPHHPASEPGPLAPDSSRSAGP